MLPDLPADPGYRTRLGRFSDIVLGGGQVPYGSPEHVGYILTCVKGAGFDVELVDGGLLATPAPEQRDLYRETLAACEKSAIDRGLVGPLLPPSHEELAAWYEALTWTHDCMAAAGYPVSDPPSLDLYVESNGRVWHPYDVLPVEKIPVVERVCPQDLVVLFEIIASGED